MIGQSWASPALDRRARSTILVDALIATLPRRPRLLLLGGASGNLVLDVAPRIGRAQVWRMLDTDAQAVSDALEEIACSAELMGYTVTFPGRALLVHTAFGAVRIEGEQMQDRPPGPRDLGEADALLCERLLPILTRRWLDALCTVWHRPLLATLNASGPARLVPMRPGDRTVLLRTSRRRQQAGLWGTGAVERAAMLLRARGFTLRRARSDWRLGPNDLEAISLWLTSMEQVLDEREPPGRRHADWRGGRIRQALAGRLRLQLPHMDLLALPT
jgi:hypothetical protein